MVLGLVYFGNEKQVKLGRLFYVLFFKVVTNRVYLFFGEVQKFSDTCS